MKSSSSSSVATVVRAPTSPHATRARPCGPSISKAGRRSLIVSCLERPSPVSARPPHRQQQQQHHRSPSSRPLSLVSTASLRIAVLLFVVATILLGSVAAHSVELLPRAPQISSTASASNSQSTASANSSIVTDPSAGKEIVIPRPFDTVGLTVNVTSDCGLFLRSFLNTPEFRACNPLSLLVETSDSFFSILTKGAYAITTVLSQTCSVSPDACGNLMDRYSAALLSRNNCGADYAALNPIVQQAYNGLVNFRTVYAAGCLKSEGGNYCYTEAATNRQAPSDATIYFLPYGKPLLEDAKPNCSKCLKDTMTIFASAAKNQSQPISKTYPAAAAKINQVCGANFTVDDVASGSPRSFFVGGSPIAALFSAAVPMVVAALAGAALW